MVAPLYRALKGRVPGADMRAFLSVLAIWVIAAFAVLHPLIAIGTVLLIIFSAFVLFILVFIMLGAPPSCDDE